MVNVVTIDIGGTNTSCSKFSKDLKQLETHTFKTLTCQSRDILLSNIKDVLKGIVDKDTIAISIGSAGQISNDGIVLSATNTFKDWVGTNLKQYFENNFFVPCFVVNDVQAMLMGIELTSLQKSITLAIAIGTGVGGGIAINNQLVRGHRGTAGELGHIVLNPDGPECPCGQKGCAEAYLSGTAIEKNYGFTNEKAEIILKDEDVLEVYIEILSTYLSSLINAFSPIEIIIAGGVAQSLKESSRHIEVQTRKKVLPCNSDVKVYIEDSNNTLMMKGLAKLCFNSI